MVKKNLSKERMKQLMIERGFLPKPPPPTVEEIIMSDRPRPHDVSKGVHPFPVAMRFFAEGEILRKRMPQPVPDPSSVEAKNVCTHCDGKGCSEHLVQHGERYCVEGTLYDRPGVLALKKVHGITTQSGFKEELLPAIGLLHRYLDLDIGSLDVRKHTPVQSGSN